MKTKLAILQYNTIHNAPRCPLRPFPTTMTSHSYTDTSHSFSPSLSSWKTTSGPIPGSKLSEGIHQIAGTMSQRSTPCQYLYEVKGRVKGAESLLPAFFYND